MTHGGQRDGAGRKTYSPDGAKRETLTLRVHPDTKTRIKILKQMGVTIGTAFDTFVENLLNELQK